MKNIFRSSSSPARPKTGQSSVRGKIISNPIPIPSALDDEFPIRNPGTGVAGPMGVGAETELQLAPPPVGTSTMPSTPIHPEAPPPEPPIASGAIGHVRGQESISASPPRPTTSPSQPSNSPPKPQGGSSPPRYQDSPPRRPNAGGNVRYSTVSTGSTAQTGQSREMPQRKKSTLRTALGRLFGRKKKSVSAGTSGENLPPLRSPSQHRSTLPVIKDPTAFNRAPERAYEPKRSVSLPITELDRALRSHSVGPEDITAIESARNSYQAEPSGRRRAATTTSRLFLSQRNEWGGLSPRPASTHGRGTKLLDGRDEADPSEIGRAITSDISQYRRRSRSLSGLHDIEIERGDIRRRSDEIRYWRESYDPGFMSPLSSNDPDNDGAEMTGANRAVETNAVMPEPPAVQHMGIGQPIILPGTPLQPFTFPNMNEMAGMKITQAANIESRINHLESRMHTLERVVSELCHAVPNFSLPMPPPAASSVPRSVPGAASGFGIVAEDQQHSASFTTETTAAQLPALYTTAGVEDTGSHMSFGDGATFTESLHPTISNPPPVPFIRQGRPISNSTVRGAASLPTLHQSGRDGRPYEEYAHLMSLIAAEKTARMALEAKVHTLSQRVDILSGGIVRAPHRPVAVTAEPPLTAKSLGTFSAFDEDPSDEEEEGSDDDDEEEDEREDNTLGPRALTRDTTVVAEPHVEIHVEDDASYSEVFETPREETAPMNQRHGYGAFGEELRDEDADGRKKAARTLSLSQLTLGKGSNADIPDIPATPTIPPGTSF